MLFTKKNSAKHLFCRVLITRVENIDYKTIASPNSGYYIGSADGYENIVDKLHLDADKTAGLKKTLITFPIISDTLINLNLIPVISTGFDKEKFEVHHYMEEVPKILNNIERKEAQ